MQTWDEYHTKTLTLGIVSGPVEGILTLCIVYACTAFLGGGSFWEKAMLPTIGISQHAFIPRAVYDLAWNEWYMVYGALVLVFNTWQRCVSTMCTKLLDLTKICRSALNVMEARRARGEDPYKALVGLLPALWTWLLVPGYLYLQPNILRHHLIPFVFYVGLINAYSVGQMIVAHLTKSRFPMHNVLLLPLAYGVLDSLGPILQDVLGVGWPSALGNQSYQVAFVFMNLGLAVGVYGSFVVDVIVAICDYLDIWCLTIKHPYDPAKEEGKKAR